MNKRDSEIVRGMLEGKGYKFTEDENTADIIIFNTCSVREHAEHKAMSIMGYLSRKKKRERIFGLIGCVAQHKKEAIFKSIPNLHFICGPSEIYRIPELISQAKGKKEKIMALGGDREARDIVYINPEHRDSKAHAYVNIMYGCDNFCSYCIVPYVRGKEVSRPARDIIKEIKELVSRGIKEVTLLGQNVNSYKGLAYSVERIADRDDKKLYATRYPLTANKCDFVGLLKKVNAIEGVKRIGFMTSHPKDASMELFNAMRELDKVDKHLHLPLQSGSDRILKLMNRGYTVEKYKKLVYDYRKAVPEARLTTDIIVGFPTETEEDFNDTKMALEEIRFDGAYIFKYSPRPLAKSAALEDDVDQETKKRRNSVLLEFQKKSAYQKKGSGK